MQALGGERARTAGGRQAPEGERDLWSPSPPGPFAVCLILYLAITILYGLCIPIFETPDANGHYAYIHELTERRGLPVQGEPSGKRVTGYVASHPPLYYALCASLTFWVPDDVDFDDWAWHNPHQTMGDADRTANKNILVHTPAERFPWRGTPLTMHISRFVSTLLGAVAVIATYGIATDIFPRQRWLALGATALTAFNPMFIFTSARVSNDAAVTAFGSLAIWGAVRLATKGLSRRGLILTGTALGLATLSKLSGAVLAPAVAVALLFDSLRMWHEKPSSHGAQRLRPIAMRWACVVLPAMIITGWWFARNVILYGELMGVNAWLSHTATVRTEPIGVLDVIPELDGLQKSYWAMFGWFNIAVAPWMYAVWRSLTWAAGVGLGLFFVNQLGPRRANQSTQRGLLVLAFALLMNLGSVWRFIMIVWGAQGRYLMPTTASISILLMLGISRLLPDRFYLSRWRPTLAALVGTAQFALAVISLFVFILPAYAKPGAVAEGDLPQDMTRFNFSFPGTPIELLGGIIETDSAHLGDVVPVTLYWRAREKPEGDALAFVQILGRDKQAITGVDCYPGRGTFPPSLWEPGLIYRDRYLLPLPIDAEAPTVAALHAGLYDEARERLPMTRGDSEVLSDLMLLDVIPLRPRKPISDRVGYPVGAELGEEITLVGYDLSAERLRAGETISVTLVWRAERSLDTDYTAFLHLIDQDGGLISQSDHPPIDGAYPTSFWRAQEIVRDPHILTTDAFVPPGDYSLVTGMYNSRTRDRLPIQTEDGETKSSLQIQDDTIVIGELPIQ